MVRRERPAKNALVALIVPLLILAGASFVLAGDRPPLMRKAPHLIYPGVNTEMDVHWQLYATEDCVVEWGPDTTYALGRVTSVEYGFDHQHSLTISDLTPGETYCYLVTAGTEVCAGTFRAAPDDSAPRVKFLAYGDTRSYPADHDSVAQAVVDAYASDPEYQTLILHAGDFVNDGNLETQWDEQFFDPFYTGIQALLRTVPLQAAMGNHEGDGILFQKYFPYPFVADRYWSFDYGPCHFTMVDQYVSYETGSPQLTWIESDLAATTKPWKFICLHEPGWSSGGGHENEIPVQDYIQPLCEQYEVAIVFGGHNHYYARASVSGTEHLTTGGGGAPLRPPGTGYPFVVVTASEFHFCKVEVDGAMLACEVVTPDGAVIDSFALELPLGADGGETRTLFLEQNLPNPFNPLTSISFVIPEGATDVRLTLHDVSGRAVRTLVDGAMPPGPARVAWDGRDDLGRQLSSGVYFARLEAGGADVFRKMTLLK